MEREEDFTIAMYRAETEGAFQLINQVAVDLGIKIIVRSVLYDSIRTIIGFEVVDDILSHTVSKASLTDENGICYSLLGIRRLKGGYPYPWYLEFEPILPDSKVLNLTILELQSVEEDSVPMVKINTIFDPWEPLEIDPSLIEKLDKWREELQAPSSPIPPTWECMGQWSYVFSADLSARHLRAREHRAYILIPFVNQVLKVSRVLSGFSGTMLFCDSHHTMLDEQGEDWHVLFLDMLKRSRTPIDFAARLKSSGLNILKPMFFKLILLDKETGHTYPCSGSGPWGIFNTRFYYFSDAITEASHLRLRIEEVFNIALETPWVFQLDLKDTEQNMELPFTLNSPYINIQGKFSVGEIIYDLDYVLISYTIEIFTGNLNYLRMRDMKILDQDGVEYPPLDKSSHWSERHGRMIKGFCFPPIHYKGSDATLEISSIDIAPIIPFEFDLVFTS